jgi:hypothetical protein
MLGGDHVTPALREAARELLGRAVGDGAGDTPAQAKGESESPKQAKAKAGRERSR